MPIGYGFLRSIYRKNPKKPYSHLKSLYGENLEKGWDAKYNAREQYRELSSEQKKILKDTIRLRLRTENRKRIMIGLISLAGTVLFMALLVWFIR